jgi:nucleotide-binding universal stress UspA family protein
MKRIICAIDHSAPSLRAAKLAGSMAKKFGAELRFLTVVGVLDAQQDDIKQYLEREHNPESPAVALAEVAEDALRARADHIASEYGIYVVCEVRTGEAAAQIIAAVREHASDLLVVGHASRSRLARAFVGSTARRIIETAPCPVLVVP